MRITCLLPALVLGGLLGSGPAAASQIYRWADAAGNLHFTERLERVPPAHRKEALRSASKPPGHTVQTFSGPSDPAAPAASPRKPGNASVRIPFTRQGSLMRVDARINDTITAPFLIDTGASGVSLPSSVADKLGIPIRVDTPHARVMTANGIVSRPVVRLDSIEVGGARVEGLTATVNPSMDIGLLGGSFFNNFVYRVDAAENVISLTPNDQLRGGLGEAEWRQRFRTLLDLLAELDAHLSKDVVRPKEEVATLERHRADLEAQLERLQLEANRLDVPYSWRQ